MGLKFIFKNSFYFYITTIPLGLDDDRIREIPLYMACIHCAINVRTDKVGFDIK